MIPSVSLDLSLCQGVVPILGVSSILLILIIIDYDVFISIIANGDSKY